MLRHKFRITMDSERQNHSNFFCLFAPPNLNVNVRRLSFELRNRCECPTNKRTTSINIACATLPAWEREYERERGLVGTSYETATVETVEQVGQGFLKISVDTSVTCTSQTYLSEGQFLYLKPWGDEDGSIEPCCFISPPGDQKLFEFYIPEVSPVGEAALAGEMLEVSDVMGEGFRSKMQSQSYIDSKCVVGVCIEQFSLPTLLALEKETERPCTLFVITDVNGPFGNQIQQWANFDSMKRTVYFFEDDVGLLYSLKKFLKDNPDTALLMSGDADLSRMTEELVVELENTASVRILAP